MTQIEDLQARLAQALERIGASVDGWQPPEVITPEPEPEPEPAAPVAEASAEELAELRDALEDEKLANAQLEERIRALKAGAGEGASAPESPPDPALQEQLAAQKASMAALDGELQRLRSSNDSLREVCEALREANAKGASEPHLINKALLAELEGLRAVRASDAAEVQAVMGALAPLLTAEETA